MNKMRIVYLLSALFLCVHNANAVVGYQDFSALEVLGNQVGEWWRTLPNERPKSIGILPVVINKRLDESYARAAEVLLAGKIAEDGVTRVVICQECRVPKMMVSNDKIVINKGVLTNERIAELATSLNVETFLNFVVTKTPVRLVVTVSWVEPKRNAVIASKSFSVPHINRYDTAMQFKLGAGLYPELQPTLTGAAVNGTRIPFGFDFTWLSYLGAATKMGVNVGGILFGPTAHTLFIQPEVSWKIRLGQSVFSLQPSVKGGFGVRGTFASDEIPNVGATAGAALDIFLGEVLFIGANTLAYIPVVNTDQNKIVLYPGVHIGFSLGQ